MDGAFPSCNWQCSWDFAQDTLWRDTTRMLYIPYRRRCMTEEAQRDGRMIELSYDEEEFSALRAHQWQHVDRGESGWQALLP